MFRAYGVVLKERIEPRSYETVRTPSRLWRRLESLVDLATRQTLR